MENTLMQLEAIRHQNALFSPAPGDVSYPHIATHDIADVAARLLLQRDWSGKRIRGLHGPEDLTYNEVAQILSEATGHVIVQACGNRIQTGAATEGFCASRSI
jgi:uncharacterized protein YbjT (DUF2867 family)